MIMMSGSVKRVTSSPRRAVDQPNRWEFRMSSECRRRETVAVRRAAGNPFQMCRPATTKLLIPSVVVHE